MIVGLTCLAVLLFNFCVEPRVLETFTTEDALGQRFRGNPDDYRRQASNGTDIVSPRSSTSRTVSPPDLVPRNSDHPIASTWAPTSDSSIAITTTRDVSLQPRYLPIPNFLGGYRMTWDPFEPISPSIHAAHALFALFSKLLDTVRDHWSRQSSLSSFQVKYGSLRLTVYCADRAVPGYLVADLARRFLARIERGLLGFFHVVFRFPEYVDPVTKVLGAILVGVELVVERFPGDGYLRNIIG
ncbi:MAG: hypothetical protein Q9188_005346 [Gyalolechia gomerana]